MIPNDFWWGTASSATQSEGAAPASVWKRWEDEDKAPPSGEGNGFATNYADDFGLYAEHGLTHHRLSLDWARLEPVEGKHDPAAIEHYTELLRSARAAGISVWACLHHVSLPGWFDVDLGGFIDDRARSYQWPRHVDFMAETFGDLVHGWMPINEPVSYAYGGWVTGEIPPGRHDLMKFGDALRAINLAYLGAWKLLRSGTPPVATVMNLSPVYPAVQSREPDERDAAGAAAIGFDGLLFTSWIRALRDGILAIPGRPEEEIEDFAGAFDLIGFTYDDALSVYADQSVGPYPADARVGPTGQAPWAEGLGVVLRRLNEELPGRPFVITGYGVATDAADPLQDEWRVQILRAALGEVERAIDDGIDLRGFFHWSGVDQYEWSHGFDVQTGLFDRDRRPKPSALLAAEWARRGAAGG